MDAIVENEKNIIGFFKGMFAQNVYLAMANQDDNKYLKLQAIWSVWQEAATLIEKHKAKQKK